MNHADIRWMPPVHCFHSVPGSFDIYEGAQIKTGFKSVAYSIVFRAKDKTLEDADVSTAMDRILKALEGMGIELRK